MALTAQQLSTLKAAILADTDPAVVAALAIRNDTELARLYNLDAPGPVKAWLKRADKLAIFDAMNVNLYDNVAAGKRAAWEMLMDIASVRPIDFGQQNKRNAVTDVWSAQTVAQRQAILNGLTENATKAEVALGGQNRTTESITALDRNFEGDVTIADIGAALNG